ncbi:MAG TPA: caspase family protein [Anaerolineales bacterium]|jgi:uncharacterized caspase-like protein/uncharacterized protein YebE (UPF0316 family)|nr:caspase family protein [Anaerolineales bacterium]
MSAKYALIIGNTEYADPGLAQLTAPGKDADDFARVLQDKGICSFDEVNVLLNQPESTVRGAIDEFFDGKKSDDLLVLYFSGHGVRDELGALYLAVKNTTRSRLRSTAIKSDYIREVMDQSRSRRQVLVLDCCNSGAFQQGTKAATGMSVGTATAFESGFGRIILTASDSTQFAWEGDKVIGETDNSLFTHYLVEGLEGEADLDGDGRITVDELYDYAYEKVKHATPKQTPSKFSSKQQGEIILRQNMPMDEIRSVPLPTPLLDSIENPFSDIRLGAVQQLTKLLNGKNLGLARSAREALEKIAEEDDSRQVQRAAAQALESVQAKERPDTNYVTEIKARGATPERFAEDAQSIIHKQAVEAEHLEKSERLAPQTFETTRPEAQKANEASQSRLALMTLGWAIAGVIAGITFDASNGAVGGVIGGVVGGFITAKNLDLQSNKKIFWVALAWAVGLGVGWQIGDELTETIGIAIGYTIGGMISVAIMLSLGLAPPQLKSRAWIVLAWTIGGGVGWFISKKLMIEMMSLDYVTSWGIGTAIGWAIGGFVLAWQLLQDTSSGTNESNGEVTNSTKPSQIKLTATQKTFLLSPLGRSLLGAIVGLILGTLYGVIYGKINGLTYDFAYAYSTFYLDVPHIILLITCALAGLTIYPHKVSIVLLAIGFVVAGLTQSSYLYTFIAVGGIYGLPAGALISRVLFWLKIIE